MRCSRMRTNQCQRLKSMDDWYLDGRCGNGTPQVSTVCARIQHARLCMHRETNEGTAGLEACSMTRTMGVHPINLDSAFSCSSHLYSNPTFFNSTGAGAAANVSPPSCILEHKVSGHRPLFVIEVVAIHDVSSLSPHPGVMSLPCIAFRSIVIRGEGRPLPRRVARLRMSAAAAAAASSSASSPLHHAIQQL